MLRIVPPLLLVVALFSPAAAGAQATEGLTPLVDAYVAPLQALHVFSGVLLVARGDSVLFQKAYGMAEREQGVALTPTSVFRIASITKSFTRALAGRLADRGDLDLDAPIRRWLPAFPRADSITIRLLLDHRAGVPNVNSLPYDEESIAANTLVELVDSLARMPLDFAPGSARQYSNGGYAVTARILELAAGRDYDALLQEEIVGPIGLKQTRDERDGQIVPGRARGYAPDPMEFGRTVHAPFQEMATKVGGGSLVSTAGDLHQWALALGHHTVLKPATWVDLFPQQNSWALTGRAPGYNVALLREGDLVAVVLVNNYAAGMTFDVARALIELAAGRTPEALAVSAPLESELAIASAIVGSYHLPVGYLQLDDVSSIDIRRVEDGLVAFLGSVPIDVLVPQGDRSFLLRSLWTMATFEASVGGVSPGLELRPLYRDVVYVTRRVEGGIP